jgi:hypothetical protein
VIDDVDLIRLDNEVGRAANASTKKCSRRQSGARSFVCMIFMRREV